MLYQKIGMSLLAVALSMSLTSCQALSMQTITESLDFFGQTDSDSSASDAESGRYSAKPVAAPAETVRESAAMLSLFWTEDSDAIWQGETMCSRAVWESLYLSGEDAAVYPELTNQLNVLNRETADSSARWMAEMKKTVEGGAAGAGNDPYIYTQRNAVQRADQTILSILHQIDRDIDAFSSSRTVWSTNLDPATGKEVTLADVFVDPAGLPALLEKQCSVEGQVPGGNIKEYLQAAIARNEFLWTADFQKVTFAFPFAGTASNEQGQISASIWFRQSPELFQEKFRNPAAQSAVRLSLGVPLEIDLDSRDARVDTILAAADQDEFGGYTRLTLTVNGTAKTLLPDGEIGSHYMGAMYLVHLADGQQVLYLDTMLENAYHVLSVYHLPDMQLLERYWGLGFYEQFADDTGNQMTLFTDPADFRLYKREELLGTMWASGDFQADTSSGLPLAKTSYFDLDMPRTLTTKTQVGATALPEQKQAFIAAGTMLTLLRTDCLSYVDVRTPDGREYRISVDASQWPITVNGIPADTCFDGMLYTG